MNSVLMNFQKAYEELIELSLELIHKVNKPHKSNDSDIIKELADTQIRLWFLEDYYGRQNINTQIEIKLNKTLKNVNNRRRSNQKV